MKKRQAKKVFRGTNSAERRLRNPRDKKGLIRGPWKKTTASKAAGLTIAMERMEAAAKSVKAALKKLAPKARKAAKRRRR